MEWYQLIKSKKLWSNLFNSQRISEAKSLLVKAGVENWRPIRLSIIDCYTTLVVYDEKAEEKLYLMYIGSNIEVRYFRLLTLEEIRLRNNWQYLRNNWYYSRQPRIN